MAMAMAATVSPERRGNFSCPQDGRLHHEHLDDHVRQRAHDLLLVDQSLHIFLRGRACREQRYFFGIAQDGRSAASGPSAVSPRARPGKYVIHHPLNGGHQRQLAGHRALEQPSCDDQPVDFVRALEDAVDARIAVGALRRILLSRIRSRRRSGPCGRQRGPASPIPSTLAMEHSTAYSSILWRICRAASSAVLVDVRQRASIMPTVR